MHIKDDLLKICITLTWRQARQKLCRQPGSTLESLSGPRQRPHPARDRPDPADALEPPDRRVIAVPTPLPPPPPTSMKGAAVEEDIA